MQKEDTGKLSKKKMKNKRAMNKPLILIVGALLLISFITFVIALTSDEQTALQDELNNLTSQLSDDSYSWLIDYNLSYLSIEVYRENDNEIIALFENVLEDKKYRILLDGLHGGVGLGNDTEDVFDLKVKGAGDKIKIPWNVYEKKKRVDEIRWGLNNNLINTDNLMLSNDNKILTDKNGN